MFGAVSAAWAAENRKRLKYANLEQCYYFVPFAVDTLCPWWPQAKLLANKLSDRLIQASGDHEDISAKKKV